MFYFFIVSDTVSLLQRTEGTRGKEPGSNSDWRTHWQRGGKRTYSSGHPHSTWDIFNLQSLHVHDGKQRYNDDVCSDCCESTGLHNECAAVSVGTFIMVRLVLRVLRALHLVAHLHFTCSAWVLSFFCSNSWWCRNGPADESGGVQSQIWDSKTSNRRTWAGVSLPVGQARNSGHEQGS